MANKTEPWGPTTAAIIAAVFGVVVDKVLLLDKFTENQPFLPRAFFLLLLVSGLVVGQRYYAVLGGSDSARESREHRRYLNLRRRLAAGGTPALVYSRWLR